MALEKKANIAQIFWSAAAAPSDERTPSNVVSHALACLSAFDQSRVTAPNSDQPLTLMSLLAQAGIEENLVYSSPEMVRGEGLDERSLVFTIGVLIFERLTDHHPFGTRDDSARVARIRRGEMGSGVNFLPLVPGNLRQILIRAMGPFPEERYKDMAALRADLEAFLRKGPQPRPQSATATAPAQTAAKSERSIHEDLTVPATSLPSFDVSSPDADSAPDAEDQPKQQHSVRQRKATLRRAGEPVPLPPRAATAEDPPSSTLELTEADLAGKEISSRDSPAQELSANDLPVRPTRIAEILRFPVPELAGQIDEDGQTIAAKRRDKWQLLIRFGVPAMCLLLGILIATIFFVLASSPKSTTPTAKSTTPSAKSTAPTAKSTTPPATTATPDPVSTSPLEKGAPAPEATAPTAKPEAKGQSPRERMDLAGQRLAEMTRPCGLSKQGASVRLALYLNKDGKVLQVIVGKEPQITDEKIACVKRLMHKQNLGIILPRPGFGEWRLRIFPDRVESAIVGPADLMKLLK